MNNYFKVGPERNGPDSNEITVINKILKSSRISQEWNFQAAVRIRVKLPIFGFQKKNIKNLCDSKNTVFHVFNHQYSLTLTYLLYSESVKRVIFRPPTQEKSDDDSFVPPLPDYDPILPPSGFKNNSRKEKQNLLYIKL